MATAGVLIFQRGPKLGYPLKIFQNFRLDIFIKSFYEKSNTFHLLLNTYFRASSDSLSCGSWVFRPPSPTAWLKIQKKALHWFLSWRGHKKTRHCSKGIHDYIYGMNQHYTRFCSIQCLKIRVKCCALIHPNWTYYQNPLRYMVTI